MAAEQTRERDKQLPAKKRRVVTEVDFDFYVTVSRRAGGGIHLCLHSSTATRTSTTR